MIGRVNEWVTREGSVERERERVDSRVLVGESRAVWNGSQGFYMDFNRRFKTLEGSKRLLSPN